MMNDIFRIVRVEHELRNAKFNNAQAIEGVTVSVPNVFDRALAALRHAAPPSRIVLNKRSVDKVAGRPTCRPVRIM
jgi:hypothetical protein